MPRVPEFTSANTGRKQESWAYEQRPEVLSRLGHLGSWIVNAKRGRKKPELERRVCLHPMSCKIPCKFPCARHNAPLPPHISWRGVAIVDPSRHARRIQTWLRPITITGDMSGKSGPSVTPGGPWMSSTKKRRCLLSPPLSSIATDLPGHLTAQPATRSSRTHDYPPASHPAIACVTSLIVSLPYLSSPLQASSAGGEQRGCYHQCPAVVMVSSGISSSGQAEEAETGRHHGCLLHRSCHPHRQH